MNSIIETLNQFGVQFLSFAWPMLWQSSLLIGFVLALDFLLARKIRASVRYALWLAVLVKLLLPPTLALPTGAAWWLFHAPPVVKAPAIKNYTVTYDTTPLADYVPPTVALPPPAPPQLNGAGWALLATGVISAGLLLWLALRWWQVARMVRGATVSEGLVDLMEAVRRQAGLRSRIRLKLIEGRMSPAVCGLFRPVILLPRTLAENLSATQLRAVLLHEVFHLRRKDVWVNCAQALLQIVYWWHPLLWIANARIRRVREEAVDDAVMLALREEADSYAPTLLEVAKLAFRRPLLSLGLVGIMESRSALRQRIERLVDFCAPRKAGLTFASVLAICAFSAVALPMGEGPSLAEKQSAPNTAAPEPQPQFALTFKMTHPEGEGVLKNQLLDAGVKILPTIIHDFNNGKLFARGTRQQLVLVQQTIWRLNGYSPQEVASATNIPDYAVKIPVDEPATTQLYSRTFGVSKDVVYANLLKPTSAQSNVVNSPVIAPAFRKLFVELGLNLESPPGKSIFYNEKLGKLFVKATASDLDVIECAVGAMIQPSAQNASGYSPPVGAANVIGIVNAYPATSGQGTATSPADGEAKVGALIQDGKLLYEMGKLDEAKAKLKAALALEPDNAAALYYSNLVAQAESHRSLLITPGQDRKSTIYKLDHIRLAQASFDHQPLDEVLRWLTGQSKENDPEKVGVNFRLDSSDSINTNIPTITIPSLIDVRLADAIDVIVGAASKPVRYSLLADGSVVFSSKNQEQLFSRTFSVGPNTFYHSLKNFSAQGLNSVQTNGNPYAIDIGDGGPDGGRYVTTVNPASDVSIAAKEFFTSLGVNLDAPPGKAIFYNDRLSKLFVKATAEDLDTIGRAISALNQTAPQMHIKAWFIQVPKGTLAGLTKMVVIHNQPVRSNQLASITGILTGENFKSVLQNLETRSGVEILAEPEVTTLSGRQTQMRATEVITVITNMAFYDVFTNQDGLVVSNSIVPQTGQLETGPILDVVPYVLADGYTINLSLIPSLTEFLGYDTPTNTTAAYNRDGEKIDVPRVLPRFATQQTVATLNLSDGQTVIIGGMTKTNTYVTVNKVPVLGDLPLGGRLFSSTKKEVVENDILIFVTATIVDPAGNRVHSTDELPFWPKGIPSRPKKTVSDYFDDMNPNEQRSGRTQ